MYIGTLTEVTDPFIDAFVNENYSFMINSLRNNFYLNESNGDANIIEPNNASATKSKMQKFIDWLKKNLWHKPRAWIAGVLNKLNAFAAKIAFLEETKPFERSLWSKIKAAIAKAIVLVTNKLENFIRPDKIGVRKNLSSKSISLDRLKSETKEGKEYLESKPGKEKREWILMKYGISNDPEIEARLKRHEDLRSERNMEVLAKDGRRLYKDHSSANESELERQRRELEEIIRNVENGKG